MDYPTFNWTKDGNKIKKVAQIPGWSSNAGYTAAQMAAMGQMSPMTQMAPMGQMAPMPQGIPVAQIPQNAFQRDTIAPVTALNLLNGTINNQADIASIDKASMDTSKLLFLFSRVLWRRSVHSTKGLNYICRIKAVHQRNNSNGCEKIFLV